MKLPNGEKAIVDEAKLRDFLLNPDHAVGRHHAASFDRHLGIRHEHSEMLKAALVAAAKTGTVLRELVTTHGRKFEMEIDLAGPKGDSRAVAVWIIDEGAENPQLVTCFVG